MTLEQQRSEFALNLLQGTKANQLLEESDFTGFMNGIPTMILQNGFGQALAFLLSRISRKNGLNKYEFAFNGIKDWLQTRNLLDKKSDNASIMENISKMTQSQYLEAQEESMKLLQWLKRYVKAFGKGDD